MIERKLLFCIIAFIILLFSCREDDFDKYERPEWLPGKVFSTIKNEETLSTFVKCLELTGYDKIIDVSGSYTVFAPTNEAFRLYLEQHPAYSTVEDIPADKLLELVKFHIVQNPWRRDQLRSLDVNGWIDPEDEYNDEPRGFKRETLLLGKDVKFGVKVLDKENELLMIIDTTQSGWHRRVATDSRKYAPIFYSEYFGIYNLQLSDLGFYFNRQFENPDDMFYVNAKLIGEQIFAENGFINMIDRVVEPLKNANEILRSKTDQHDYSKFLDLINMFPSFVKNDEKTESQPGADEGLLVDTIYDLSYPELTFDISNEKTKAPAAGAGLSGRVTIRFHHGLMAPTNAAFDEFVNQYISGPDQWGSLGKTPMKIQKIIVNSYFSFDPFYDTDIQRGFYNGEQDLVRPDYSSIVHKEFGSNCTFIGLDKPLVPRAFKSVTGPVYRRPGFSRLMNAIEYSGMISALKKEGNNYALFVVPDEQLRIDSTLKYNPKIRKEGSESFSAFLRAKEGNKHYPLTANDIRLLLLNQTTVELPRGYARKEFLKTMAGNFIVWDNIKGTAKGTANSTNGFAGSGDVVDVVPVKISTDTDNGDTYSVNAWFSFDTKTIYNLITGKFPEFHKLLEKAGLADNSYYRYNFLSDNEFYTVFIPTKEALDAINAGTMAVGELADFLKLHFIVGDMIFTDGKLSEGYYDTACEVKTVTNASSRRVKVYIKPGVDKISISGKNGGDFVVVNESEAANMISARDLSSSGTTSNFKNTISTAVIHTIDKALKLDQLDVK